MTSGQPIAVLGATGNQGGHVAQALLEAGWRVRAITRHPESQRAKALASYGAELIQADMGEVDTLIHAFDGAHGIFSVQNFWDLGMQEEVRLGTNVIDAAKAVGTPHVVYSSGLGAEQLHRVVAIDGKAIIEQRLRQSGLPFTILRPGLFMDDFRGASLPFARPIQRMLRHHHPLVGRVFLATLRDTIPSDSLIPLTTLQDVGRMAAWAFHDPDVTQGHAYGIVGSAETAETLCNLWNTFMGPRIPDVPGLRLGLRLFHRKMAVLLDWLGQHETAVTKQPLELQTYAEWLLSIK